MPFSYHPPTREYCHVCEELIKGETKAPIIDTYNGKASSAVNFPIHNWFYFVLGYSPEFPNYILDKYLVTKNSLVVDPFMGTGTTLVACKLRGIPSGGVDANIFFADVAKVKLQWNIDINNLKKIRLDILNKIPEIYAAYDFAEDVTEAKTQGLQLSLFENHEKYLSSVHEYDVQHRMNMLDRRYISEKPFVRWHLIKELIDLSVPQGNEKNILNLALASILVPSSNVRYGPGFGVIKPKDDIDVYNLFRNKLDQMISDLELINDNQKDTISNVYNADSRYLSNYFESNSIDMMITSPPYPGDHEYTKHTRLELIALGYAQDIQEFRKIKKKMLRGSTTNIYKEDNDQECVKHIPSIIKITSLVDERLKADGATSGFEKLYVKLIWEYFGGMSRVFQNALTVLKPGGTFHLLVSDSHAFKMVHIQTAQILAEIGLDVGFKDASIDLWQDKMSTSHKYHLMENILTLTK